MSKWMCPHKLNKFKHFTELQTTSKTRQNISEIILRLESVRMSIRTSVARLYKVYISKIII